VQKAQQYDNGAKKGVILASWKKRIIWRKLRFWDWV